jgi:WD40 repeat protein
MSRATLVVVAHYACVWALVAIVVLAAQPATAQLRYLEGHEGPIYSVAYTPDGTMLVTGSYDQTVKLWDRASGTVLRTLRDHTSQVFAVAVSDDGLQLASAGNDRTVRLYDLPVRDPIAELPLAAEGRAVAITADGRLLLVGDAGRGVHLIDPAQNKPLRDLAGATAAVRHAALSPDGQQAFVLGEDGAIHSWRTGDAQGTGTVHVPASTSLAINTDNRTLLVAGQDGAVRLLTWPPAAPLSLTGAAQGIVAAAYSWDNQWLAVASADGQVRLYKTADGQLLRSFAAAGGFRALAIRRDNAAIAVACADGMVRFFNVADGQPLGEVEAHAGGVADVAYSPNNQQLATAGADGLVRLWVRDVPAARDTQPHAGDIRALALAPNGSLLATAGADKSVKLLAAADGAPQRALAGHEGDVLAVAFHPGSGQIATGSADQKLRVFNTGDGNVLHTIEGHAAAIRSVAFSPNGQQIASGGDDKLVKIWNAADGMPLRDLPGHTGAVVAVEYLPNGAQLVTGGDTSVRIWNAADGAAVRTIDTQAPVACLAVSRDSNLVAVGGADHKIRLYRVGDGSAVTVLEGHTAAIASVAFSPDGQRLLSTSADHSARWWDIQRGAELQRYTQPRPARGGVVYPDGRTVAVAAADGHVRMLPVAALGALAGHEGAVHCVAYNNNGSHLASGGADKTVRLWNTSNPAAAQQERTYEGATDAVRDVEISRDNNLLAAAGQDAHVRVWKLADASIMHDVALPAAATALAFSPDNQRLALACEDKLVRLVFVPSGVVGEHFPHTAAVRAVAFSQDSRTLTSGADDRSATLWTPTLLRCGKLHQGPIHAIAAYTNGAQFFTAGEDQVLAMWNLGDLNQVRKFEQQETAAVLRAVARSANGQILVAGGSDGQLRAWNVNGQPLAQTSVGSPIVGVAVSNDAQKVIALASDGVLSNYGFRQVQGRFEFFLAQQAKGHSGQVAGLALSDAGDVLFTTGADKSVKRWLPARETPRFTMQGHQQAITFLDFSPDGKRLASAAGDNTIRLWNTANGQNYATCNGHGGPVYCVEFHPTQDQLISCSFDQTVRLWNASTGTQLTVLREEIDDALYSVDYSADGSTFVIAGASKAWRLWRTGEQRPANSVFGHNDYVYRAAFNPAATRVATLGYSGALYVWDTSGVKLLEQPLPVKVAHTLAWSPDGSELAIATSDARLLLLTVPQQAR